MPIAAQVMMKEMTASAAGSNAGWRDVLHITPKTWTFSRLAM